jgi:PAS domain S-box-containing protein
MRTSISRFATRRAFTIATLALLAMTVVLGWEDLREQRLNAARESEAVVDGLLLLVSFLGVSAVLLDVGLGSRWVLEQAREGAAPPVRLVGVFQDITSRVAERQALEYANTRTALATDSCGIGIWDWDMQSGKFDCDPLMFQLHGLKPVADKLFDLAFWAGRVHVNDRTAVEQALQDCVDGIRPYDAEFRTVWDDGSIRHIKATGRMIRNQSGVAVRMVGTNMDITARKVEEAEREKIAAKLARYTRALERSNLELDAFAYAASHDLKAPLRVIHNASTWIEEDLAGHLTAEAQENMDLLRSRVRRMDRLLDDLLEYSRIGRETDDRHTEAISGTVLMENILGLISPPEGFFVDVSSALAGIKVFRMPLQQILINLISNAIKHHDKKAGRIEVSVVDMGDLLRFSVKDDGPGIAAQYHEQIFKMFQTLKPRDQVEGSGMGLALVRKHVDVAGGELKLESAVGQGSTFSFTWPKDNGSTNKTKHKFARIGETS